MRRNIARFVVDTHCHITTLYQPGTEAGWQKVENEEWTGLEDELAPFDNCFLTLYDMERYGVDMAILLPSIFGTLNETQAKLVKRFPDRFRACCSDQKTVLHAIQGKKPWTFKAALEEVEEALKTGCFVGIGEFAPGAYARWCQIPGGEGGVSLEQRLDEYAALCELGVKFDVPVLCHDQFLHPRKGNWTLTELLAKVSEMNPKAKILQTHGCVEDEPLRGVDAIRDMYTVVASLDNVYMETGGWSERQFEIAFEVGVTANHLTWGHDYGNVPQHIVRRGLEKWGPEPKEFEYRNTMSRMMFGYKDWPAVPTYQPDFYGWGLRTVDRVGDWLTQDEINLILGGTAAKLYKLPVPHPRMFAEGRPDIFGEKWRESIPFIPREQIQHPDPEGLRLSSSPFKGTRHRGPSET
ncbi:MAG: amidohydrolase family protein [Armatimonadetes bacterium]|nr:amidohydrolase family protein [Armatimonadota bacterium]